jgi:hypothetical protein
VTRSLRFVDASGTEVDRLELHHGGGVTSTYQAGVAAGAVLERTQYEGETRTDAFHWLARNGWSNGNLSIALDDLDKQE